MKLVLLITAQIEQGMSVAQGWQDAGAPGVTIIPTHGLRTLQEKTRRGDVELPMVLSSMSAAMSHVIKSIEAPGQMLLSVVSDDMVVTLENAATNILGDMTKPYNGIMLVINLEQAIGVRHHTEQGS